MIYLFNMTIFHVYVGLPIAGRRLLGKSSPQFFHTSSLVKRVMPIVAGYVFINPPSCRDMLPVVVGHIAHFSKPLYPLVICHITIENHHFQWVNQL